MNTAIILVTIILVTVGKLQVFQSDMVKYPIYRPLAGTDPNPYGAVSSVISAVKTSSSSELQLNKSLLVKCLLLLLSGDVDSNPGPRPPKYPCGICNRAVTKSCKAIVCDRSNCGVWIHNRCSGITNSRYEEYMENSKLSFICPNCNMPTYLQNMSSDIFSTSNRFHALSTLDSSSEEEDELPSINSPSLFRPAPFSTSSPKGDDRTKLKEIAKNLNVMSVNCNSMQSLGKRAELQALIEDHQPHVILGQESKLGPEHLTSEIFPSSYTTFRKDRKTGGGGVFILLRNDIDYVEGAFDEITTDSEIVWAQLKLPGTKLLNIASAYRPPNSKVEHMSKMQDHLKQVYSKYRNATYIIGGDFNLPSIDWTEDEVVSNSNHSSNDTKTCSIFLDTLNDLGLSQHCKEITRPASQNTLDLMLTNNPGSVIDVTSQPGMSDHNVVLANFKLATGRNRRPQRRIYQYKKADWDQVREAAEQLTTEYFARDPDKYSVSENGLFIEDGIQKIIDKEIPSKLSKSKESYPWITPTVRKAQRRRDRYYAKAKKTRSPKTWSKFKEARQDAKNEIRNSHREYLKGIIGENLAEDPKPFWSYIKSLRKDNTGIPTLRTKNGIPAATDNTKANALVDQFTSVFTQEDLDNLPELPQAFPDMPHITFGEHGVEKLLSNINPSKAGGPDQVPARFLKETAKAVSPMYTHLFRQSYEQGHLPDTWTKAVVCPIYKKGSRSLPENYRPVSLTAIPCKLFEHIVVSKIWEHLNKHGVITSQQHGFRTGLSCETQLIEALHDWTSVMNEGSSQVDAIVLDFSKAFDMVPHQRLLQKLQHYGITGNTKAWIASFLSGRTHQVVVNGSESDTREVTSGVPQGTVVGPLLFLLYINDIEQGLNSTIRLFADDSVIYRKIETIEDSHILQQDLFRLQEWADKWQMSFNIKKCKILRITRRTKTKINFNYVMSTPTLPPSTIEIEQRTIEDAKEVLKVRPPTLSFTPLEEITSDRYLGVILDNKLSFNEHVDTIVKKATNLLNLCRRNLNMCSPQIKETAYKSLVRPHLDYASPAWNPHTTRNISKIEAVQRRAARFVLGNYEYGPEAHLTDEINQTLKWQPLQHRRALYDLTVFYKIRNQLININFPPAVQPSPRHMNRYLHIQTLHSEAYKYHFYVRTIRLWNLLPAEIASITSIDSFKLQAASWIQPMEWARVNNTWTLI